MINNLSVVHILETLAFITGCVSMVVVLYGTLVSFLSFLKNEIRRISGKLRMMRRLSEHWISRYTGMI